MTTIAPIGDLRTAQKELLAAVDPDPHFRALHFAFFQCFAIMYLGYGGKLWMKTNSLKEST